MPIIKSAKKKLKQDKGRTEQNKVIENAYKKAVKNLKKSGGKNITALLKKTYSQIDKAVKKNVIHKNKGNRLKSKLAKLYKEKPKTKAKAKKQSK